MDRGEHRQVAGAIAPVRSSPRAEANELLESNTADHLRDRSICRRRRAGSDAGTAAQKESGPIALRGRKVEHLKVLAMR